MPGVSEATETEEDKLGEGVVVGRRRWCLSSAVHRSLSSSMLSIGDPTKARLVSVGCGTLRFGKAYNWP